MPIATTVSAGNWFSSVESVVNGINLSQMRPKKITIAINDSKTRFSPKKRNTRVPTLAKTIPLKFDKASYAPRLFVTASFETNSLNAAAKMSSWRQVFR